MRAYGVAVVGVAVLLLAGADARAAEGGTPQSAQATGKSYARACMTLFQSETVKAKGQSAPAKSCGEFGALPKPDAVSKSSILVRDAVVTVTVETTDGKTVTVESGRASEDRAKKSGPVVCWEDTHTRNCCLTNVVECCWLGDKPLGCGKF